MAQSSTKTTTSSTTQNKRYTGTVTQNNHPTITYQLTIQNGKDTYLCEPLNGVTLTRGSDCIPSKLNFKIPYDGVLQFTRGNMVVFKVNEAIAFQGYIFESETSKDKVYTILAYDQMRYLKNKDCFVYHDTASEVIKNICRDYDLHFDEKGIANTQYKLSRVEDNKTLADIIMRALILTEINAPGHPIYVCYDDAGQIRLKDIYSDDLTLDILLDVDVIGDYNYKASIDKETYNMVKVVREAPGDKGGKALVKTGVAKDRDHINQWGILQHLLKPDSNTMNPIDQAKRFLTLHDCETREIKLRNVIGDIRVRGGSRVFVQLDLGDIKLSSYLLVTDVTHHFEQNYHSMDIDLSYKEKAGKWEVTYDNDAAVLAKIKAAEAAKNKSGVSGSGSYSNSEKGAYSYLKSLGFTDNQAAGIMGNIKKEDADYDPSAVNSSGHTGIFQLSTDEDGGKRWQKYCDWCNANGMEPENNQNQIQYVCLVENGDLREKLPDNAQQAATWFNNNIEISGDTSGDRENYAVDYSNRIATGAISVEQPTYPTSFGAGGADSDQVDAGISACDRHYFGENGCVRCVVTAGSNWDTGLAEECNKGTASVETLCTDMKAKGYTVEAFNGYANKGDILVYGDYDHAVVSNGVGGCWGNSTQAGYRMIYYDDANYAWGNNESPTMIIRMK